MKLRLVGKSVEGIKTCKMSMQKEQVHKVLLKISKFQQNSQIFMYC